MKEETSPSLTYLRAWFKGFIEMALQIYYDIRKLELTLIFDK